MDVAVGSISQKKHQATPSLSSPEIIYTFIQIDLAIRRGREEPGEAGRGRENKKITSHPLPHIFLPCTAPPVNHAQPGKSGRNRGMSGESARGTTDAPVKPSVGKHEHPTRSGGGKTRNDRGWPRETERDRETPGENQESLGRHVCFRHS